MAAVTGFVAGPATAGFLGFEAGSLGAAAVTGAVAGAAGGATFAGLSGGNPLLGAVMGGVAGFIGGGGLGGGIIGDVGFDFGKTIFGKFATEIANDLGRGFLMGTATSLISGRKFGDALTGGLAFGIFSAAGAQANNLVGHTVGFIASGFRLPEPRNGGFFYKTNLPFVRGFAIGNAITYNPANVDLAEFARLGTLRAPYDIRAHELGHVPQARVLGVLNLPAHVTSLAISGILTGGQSFHRYNLLERVLHPFPSFD